MGTLSARRVQAPRGIQVTIMWYYKEWEHVLQPDSQFIHVTCLRFD